MKSSQEINPPVILFDGVCNYCNAWVNFFIRHDKKEKIKFAPLQSETGKNLLRKYNVDEKTVDSIVLIENGKSFVKSTAGLRSFSYLDGGWKIFYGLLIVPPFLRNFIYDWIARNRYRWWGKKEQCMIPNENVKSRFVG